ncbi:MFS transporter [Natronosporangium hydrolyticum]|uniref:MFS transporter n=1 Tax=Natronosporangium hydrolyticum TaxID=2811111 RepID=A0A895YJQ7_9ACTN|nr:MFS transporter [Natronosporangium hydrolyticum]QSB14846.1 MFS transporter [Natronosporangium hydrolyticum]
MTEHDPTGTRSSHRAGWRQWLGLLLLVLPMLALATDLTVLFLAMPSIAGDLSPGTSQMLWIVHVYGFFIGGFLITMGRLGDRVGRRRLLLIGTAAFGILSLIAAYSVSAEMLIVVRALLGIAGATLMPSAYSLLRNLFHHPRQLRFAIAAMMAAFGGGTALGPVLGGVLLEFFWWGSVFLVNLPPLMLLLVLGPLLLPEFREPSGHRLDLASVALSLGAILGIIFGIQEMAEHGIHIGYLVAITAGVGLAVLFIRRQLRLPDPLLDLRLFRNRRFTASLAAVLMLGIGTVGGFYLFTQYLQWVAGLSPLTAGLWTVPFSLATVLGMLVAPALSRWLRPAYVIGGGLLVSAVGLTGAAVLTTTGSVTWIAASYSLGAIGQGAATALLSDLIIATAPLAQAGSAASMQEVSGELGVALGIAFGGGAGMLVYRATLTDSVPPAVPQESADTARSSVAEALEVAGALPGAVGSELLQVIEEAFTRALQVGFGFGAVAVTVVAVLILVVLGRYQANRYTDGDGPSQSEPATAETTGEPAARR